MQYLITFIEGIVSFISPCMLPMLPIYISYFAGGGADKKSTLARSIAFTLGFAAVFTLLGVFAGSLGSAVEHHRHLVNITCGVLIIGFGLSYLGLFKLPFTGMKNIKAIDSVFSAFIFGVIYSLNLTPCVGAFLGSALVQAASEGGSLTGALLLLSYSAGLGIPFVLSSLLINRFADAFAFVKKHYRIINPVCGIFLIVIGILMASGQLGKLMVF